MLSRLALTSQQGWTEDEKDDEDSPSPGSTSGSDEDGARYGDEDDSGRLDGHASRAGEE